MKSSCVVAAALAFRQIIVFIEPVVEMFLGYH